MNTTNVPITLLATLFFAVGCRTSDKGYADTGTPLCPVDTGDTLSAEYTGSCSGDDDELCIIFTATVDASDALEAAGSSLIEEAAAFDGDLQDLLAATTLDAHGFTYDIVIIPPDELEDASPYDDSLITSTSGVFEDTQDFLDVIDNFDANTLLSERQAYEGADVVITLVGTGHFVNASGLPTAQGFAPVGTGESSYSYARAWGYAEWDKELTTLHELGHILGGKHDVSLDTNCGAGNFPFACAYVDDNNFVTLMSSVTSCTDSSQCSREINLSNPDQSLSTTGVTYEHNACVVYNMWDYVSDYSDFVKDSSLACDLPASAFTLSACPTMN